MNPFLILNVDMEDDDATIRKAYLNLVKLYNSDKDPEKFSLVTVAYDTINTKRKRYKYCLSQSKAEYNSPMSIIKNNIAFAHLRKPMPFKEMKEFFKQCSKT